MLTQQKEVDFTGKDIFRNFKNTVIGTQTLSSRMNNVGITMNLYVHVTENEKVKEVEEIEKALKIVQ